MTGTASEICSGIWRPTYSKIKAHQQFMITGSCLCGGVRYEIDGEIGLALNCHCSMCRKATGSAFRSRMAVPLTNFRWTAGKDLLTLYASSPTTTRTFCKVCGSTLVSLFHDNPETLGLPMGTLDDDPGIRPAFHVFVGSKAPWFEIADQLPQFERSRLQNLSGKTGVNNQDRQ